MYKIVQLPKKVGDQYRIDDIQSLDLVVREWWVERARGDERSS